MSSKQLNILAYAISTLTETQEICDLSLTQRGLLTYEP